jgi:Zn-dependent protease/CBS domain-containing protein
MSRHVIPLGRILGIPLGLDPSWFLVFVLVTWTLAVSYYPTGYQNWPAVQYWVVAVVTALLFFASVVLHELGHAVVARHYQIPVRRITLFIFGGVSEIGAEPNNARTEFWIAIVGPAVSLGLAAVFGILEILFASLAPLLALAKYLAYINGVLGLFNLIPGFPLDGGRVLQAILWGITHNVHRATVIAGNVGRAFAFLFIILGISQVLAGNLIGGLWIAFIGWFLESAASGQIQQQTLHERLAGRRVAQVMNPGCVSVPADLHLQDAVDRYILGGETRCLIVVAGEHPVGLLTLHSVKEVPRSRWAETTVEEAMLPMASAKRIAPDAEVWEALEEMNRDGVNQLPVTTNGQVVGMLSRGDIIGYLQRLREVGT